MNGSKTPQQRLNLISSIDKIIFVSEWIQKRFFIGIDDKLKTKTEIVYPGVNKKRKISKKKNLILLSLENLMKQKDMIFMLNQSLKF